jgi:tRNA pseudouridine38-40 synthase
MPKFALGIEYDGTRYHGWQAQEGQATIQAEIELALSKVADSPIEIACAGRTDKGVHAIGQVAHFSTEINRLPKNWLLGTNTHLPKDIAIRWIQEVDEAFHARFSALARRYHYIIFNRPVRSALYSKRMSWHYQPLDAMKMHEAAQHLVGEHDFQSFRASECQSRTSIREVKTVNIHRQGDLIVMDISANAFLHHMVRNIAGVLMTIGEGKENPQWAHDVLLAKDRTAAGATAHPYGLYLVHVDYPAIHELPEFTGLPLMLDSSSR